MRPPRRFQAHVLPGLASVHGFVDAVADGDVGADVGLARARPYDLGIRRRHAEGADGVCVLIVEDGPPGDAAVLGLPETARRRSGVVGEGIAHHARDRRHPVADGPDVAELQGGQMLRGNLGGDLRGQGGEGQPEEEERERRAAAADRTGEDAGRAAVGGDGHRGSDRIVEGSTAAGVLSSLNW